MKGGAVGEAAGEGCNGRAAPCHHRHSILHRHNQHPADATSGRNATPDTPTILVGQGAVRGGVGGTAGQLRSHLQCRRPQLVSDRQVQLDVCNSTCRCNCVRVESTGGVEAAAGKRRAAATPPVRGSRTSPELGQVVAARTPHLRPGDGAAARPRGGWQRSAVPIGVYSPTAAPPEVADMLYATRLRYLIGLGLVLAIAAAANVFAPRADTISRGWEFGLQAFTKACKGRGHADHRIVVNEARRLSRRRYPHVAPTSGSRTIVVLLPRRAEPKRPAHRGRHARRERYGAGLPCRSAHRDGRAIGGRRNARACVGHRMRATPGDCSPRLGIGRRSRPPRVALEQRRRGGVVPMDVGGSRCEPRRTLAPTTFSSTTWSPITGTSTFPHLASSDDAWQGAQPPPSSAYGSSTVETHAEGAYSTCPIVNPTAGAIGTPRRLPKGLARGARRRPLARLLLTLLASTALHAVYRIGEAANPGPAASGQNAGHVAGDARGRGPHGGGLSIVTGNGTSWGSLQAWLAESSYGVMCMQEHKLAHPEDIAAASTEARRRGWKSFWTTAIPSRHEAEAPSAGTVVLVRAEFGAMDPPGGSDVVPGHCSAALVEAGGIGGLVVYAVYLECGGELGPRNWHTLTCIAQHARAHGRPWAMCGDWNVTPEALAASGWPAQLGGSVLVPPVSHTTAVRGKAGRLIDYFVVSDRIAKTGLQAHVDGTATIRTHSAVGFVAPTNPRSFMTTVMKGPRKFPQDKPIGPRKEPREAASLLELARRATQLAASGRAEEATSVRDEAVAKWMDHLEGELARVYHLDEQGSGDAPYVGRSRGSTFVREPLLGVQRHRGHVAAGAEVRRLRLVQDRANELAIALDRARGWCNREVLERARAAVSAGHHALRTATENSEAAQLAGKLKAAGRNLEKAVNSARDSLSAAGLLPRDALTTVRGINGDAKAAADEREAQRMKEVRQSIAAWCREAEANGASRAHRWAQVPAAWRPEVVEQRLGDITTRTTNPDEVVAQERVKWHALWAPQGAAQELPDWGHVIPLPRPTVAQVRATARRFRKDTGQGADRISPRDIGELDDTSLEVFIEIMLCCEMLGSVPALLALVIVVLLAKKGGGRRPIGLLPAAYRLWARVRQVEVRRWEVDWDRRYFAAARGKSAADVAWLRSLRAEYASSTGATAASVLWDLKKCYEHGRYALLAHEAREVQFPLAVARLAVAMYAAPRRLMLDGAYAEPIVPTRGFIAGCTHALAALKATMIRRMDAFVRRNPSTDPDLYVDDIEVQVVGSKASVPADLGRAARDLAEVLVNDLGYPLAEDKAIAMANDEQVLKAIITDIGDIAGSAEHAANKLGIEYTCGRRRPLRGGPRRARYRKQLARRRRLSKLRRLGCSVAQVVRRGLIPAASYGGVVHGVSDHELEILTSLSAAAVPPNTRGTSRTMKMMLHGDPAIEANTGILQFWAGAAWRACGPARARRRTDPSPVLLDNALKHADKEFTVNGYSWSNVRGPAGAAVLTARRIGWQFLSGLRIADEQGTTIDLGVTDPHNVRAAVVRATHAAAAVKAARKEELGHPNDEVWTGPVLRALQGGKLVPAAKAALRRAFTGGFWTRSRLEEQGLCTDKDCELCGHGPDDKFHRIWECFVIEPLRQRYTTSDMRDEAAAAGRDHPRWTRGVAINPKSAVPPPRRDFGEEWFFGQGVPRERHFCGTVYTDGSAFNPQCGDVRRAGWSVVQVDPSGRVLKAAFGHVPASISTDQTVAAGELFALRRAVELSVGALVVKTDYQGILDGLQAGEAATTSARRPNASSWKAFWRTVEGSPPRVLKVKAHRTHQEAAACDDPDSLADWAGNRAADLYAKRGAATHAGPAGREAADAYEREFKRHTATARWIGIALSQWPRAMVKSKRDKTWRRELGLRRRTRRQRAAQEQGHSMAHGRDGWHCLTCGRSSSTWAGTRRLVLSACRGHTASRIQPQGTRPAAHVLWAAEAERTQTGALAPDVVWCARCGAYSSAKVYNLGKTCRGIPEKSARTRLAAFNMGVHPTRRHRLAPPVRLTDEVLAALSLGAAKRKAAFNKLLRGDPAADNRESFYGESRGDDAPLHADSPRQEHERHAQPMVISNSELVSDSSHATEVCGASVHGSTLDEPPWAEDGPVVKRRKLQGRDVRPDGGRAAASTPARAMPPGDGIGHHVKRRRIGHAVSNPLDDDLAHGIGDNFTEELVSCALDETRVNRARDCHVDRADGPRRRHVALVSLPGAAAAHAPRPAHQPSAHPARAHRSIAGADPLTRDAVVPMGIGTTKGVRPSPGCPSLPARRLLVSPPVPTRRKSARSSAAASAASSRRQTPTVASSPRPRGQLTHPLWISMS